jgi:hypothetical protein
MNLLVLALAPIVNVGGSQLLGWLLSLAIIAAIVWFVVWLVSKFAGPPSIPEPFRWILWIIVAIVLLMFIFAALGVRIP